MAFSDCCVDEPSIFAAVLLCLLVSLIFRPSVRRAFDPGASWSGSALEDDRFASADVTWRGNGLRD